MTGERAGDAAPAPRPPVPFWAHLAPFLGYFLAAHLVGEDSPFSVAAGAAAAGALLVWGRPWRDAAVWAHVAPFALWMSVMYGLGDPESPAAWKYALRTAAGFALLWSVRPWRWYARPQLRNLPLAVAVGLGVIAVWVGFESPWFRAHAPGLAEFYERWLVGPLPAGLGKLREPLAATPHAPSVSGWPLFAVHVFGTSVVIAMIEEFFWRGFLYRWLSGRDFLQVPLRHYDAPMFFAVAAIFGLEHAEWFAGIVCGLAFAALLRRTGDLWAVIAAHATANLALSVYVVATGQYRFW